MALGRVAELAPLRVSHRARKPATGRDPAKSQICGLLGTAWQAQTGWNGNSWLHLNSPFLCSVAQSSAQRSCSVPKLPNTAKRQITPPKVESDEDCSEDPKTQPPTRTINFQLPKLSSPGVGPAACRHVFAISLLLLCITALESRVKKAEGDRCWWQHL